jgi:hypothetical protein
MDLRLANVICVAIRVCQVANHDNYGLEKIVPRI